MADEIVVTDTGSRDRTREIAREAGAAVFEFPWNGNEADARNAALSHATGKWFLNIDADEELSPALASELQRELPKLTAGPAQALTVPLRNLFLHGAGSRSRIPRIGRAASDFRFAGVIHAQPAYHGPFHDLQGDLLHYGYQWTEEARRRKGKHLLKHLALRPDSEAMPLRNFCEGLTAMLIAGEEENFFRLWPLWRSFSPAERHAGPEALHWSHELANALPHFASRDDMASGAEAAREMVAAHPRHLAAARYLARAAVETGDWERVAALTAPFDDFSFAAGDRTQRIPDDAEPALRAWRWLAALRLGTIPAGPFLPVPASLWQPQLLPALWQAETERPGAPALSDTMATALLRLRSRLDIPSPANDRVIDRLTMSALERERPESAPFLAALVTRYWLNLRLGRRRENLTLMERALAHHAALGWLGEAFPHGKPVPFGTFVARALARL